jgi:hypothetical protein
MIREGDKVRIKPEWRSRPDDDAEFVAIEDEFNGRVGIRAQVNLTFKPWHTVDVSMVEKIEEQE